MTKNWLRKRKKKIQKQFRGRNGRIVDFLKPDFGNSNYGNTARRFFSDPEHSAEITGLDIQ